MSRRSSVGRGDLEQVGQTALATAPRDSQDREIGLAAVAQKCRSGTTLERNRDWVRERCVPRRATGRATGQGICVTIRADAAVVDITTDERREWDSNPRWVAPHTLSKRADSAALAPLQEPRMLQGGSTGSLSARVCGGGPPAPVGSGATGAREPSQVRKEAALSGSGRVPPGRLAFAASGPLRARCTTNRRHRRASTRRM